jgi:hypothetical protein
VTGWLLLWACGAEEAAAGWSQEEGLAPILAQLDADQSGDVSASEYEDRTWMSPKFDEVDQDSDGLLSAAELRGLLYSEDVQRFDGRPERKAVDKEEWARPFADERENRLIWELLNFMDQEVAFADSSVTRPSFSELDTAARTGDMDSFEVWRVLSKLQSSYQSTDLTWPEALALPATFTLRGESIPGYTDCMQTSKQEGSTPESCCDVVGGRYLADGSGGCERTVGLDHE